MSRICIIFLVALLSVVSAPLVQAKEHGAAGKVVVIIGASSGFGKGVALRLAKKGDHLILAARRTQLLKQLASACGNSAVAVTADVSKPEDVQHIADVAMEKFGHVDVWINDVGVGALGRFEDIPMADHSRLIDVNFKGIVYGSHIAMKIFRKQQHGILINLGSIDSEVPLAYQATYAATKAAVRSLDHTLAQEIRLSKMTDIKVCTVMPFAVDTPWWDHSANYSGGTPRIRPIDDPSIVVNAIVKAVDHPHKEIHVGWKAKASYYSHRLMPDLTERLSADAAEHYQIKTAPPAPATTGTLYEPMLSGSDIEGGVRARMKLEDANNK